MLIGFDVGNTHIVSGIFSDDGKIITQFRVASRPDLTEDEFYFYFHSFFSGNKFKLKEIKGAIISSVVPDLINILSMFCHKFLNIKPVIVTTHLKIPIVFSKEISDPHSLGADRLVNCVEANALYPNQNLIIIDMGTATTIDILCKNKYIGGCILPGIRLSIDALFKNTAKLPNIKFSKPATIFGRSTEEHINIGAYYGALGQINEITKRIETDLPNSLAIITGGYSTHFKDEFDSNTQFISNLNLNGLYTFYKFIKK